MRLIDADAFKKEVDNFQNCYNGWSDTYDKSFIIGAIEEQPAIDIVHCGECKWYNCGACFRDDGANNERNTDDFCSYGERKNDE